LVFRGVLTWSVFRIVEFASQEDSQRAIRELSEQPLLGRPVFIREVRTNLIFLTQFAYGPFRIGKMSHDSVLRLSQEK
jgi:RNA recognition motif-containing protein